MNVWRAEDEALLARLRDEALFESVWTALVPDGTPPPHARAAGVLAELRRCTDGALAIERAERGRFAPILRALSQPDPETLTPKLAHHLALIWDRVATRCARSEDDAARASAEKAHLRSLAMWLWLADEEDYLGRLAARVIGDALPAREVDAAARDAGLRKIATLGETARAGARDLGLEAEIAAKVLARAGEACRMAGCSDALRAKATSRAKVERDRAVDAAVTHVEEAIEEATMHGVDPDDLVPLLWGAVTAWRWADRDSQVERFLVRTVTESLWDLYRERRWNDIRALLKPLEGPIESLARRIESEPKKLAYAAPCAQMLVFRAEVARTFDEQLRIVERALRLCPTHRNARVVCADLLVDRALRALDTSMPWSTGDALASAEKDIRRALELYPELKRMDEAKRRLRKMGIDLDG